MKSRRKAVLLGAVCGLLMFQELGFGARKALYEAVLPDSPSPRLVRTAEIAIDRRSEDRPLVRQKITCTRVDGQSFRFWFVSDRTPLGSGNPGGIEFARYILQEADNKPLEYINRTTGTALLPLFGLCERLLPAGEPGEKGALFEKGTFLGHRLMRKRIERCDSVELPGDIVRLVLDPDLLIGTSRNFRDDGAGRPDPNSNYSFTPFTEADYGKMIAAGINYFLVDDRQYEWIDGKGVFYENHAKVPQFPEELFRSNFLGANMFVDEPACRMAGKHARDASPVQGARNLQEHIRANERCRAYSIRVQQSGVDLGTMDLREPAIPIWETYVGTTYYQLEANDYGLVQECRWQIRPGNESRGQILGRINREFDLDLPITPRNLFLWYYSQMIGPARALGSKWGMSIYGQAEPELRLPSMQLAYDLGASFIWFWTSDHDHHVPFTEQLELARAITDYADTHPRGEPSKLLNRAKTAIVLPYGYTLPSCFELFMYGSYIWPMDRKNEHGVTYKQVLTPAIKEIERCLKNDIAYDVLPDAPGVDLSVYDDVMKLHEDGTCTRMQRR